MSTLTELMSGSNPPHIRAAAVGLLAASTSGDSNANAEARTYVGQHPTILKRLLVLRGDAKARRLALSTLVNVSEDETAANQLIQFRVIASTTRALLGDDNDEINDSDRSLVSLHVAILSNLTRFERGVETFVGAEASMDQHRKKVAEANLLRLAERIDHFPNALFMANACSHPKGRDVLLSAHESDIRKQPLDAVLRMLSDDTSKDRRLTAASALRNCALADEEDSHMALLQRTDILGVALSRLLSPKSSLDEDDLKTAPKEVVDAFKDIVNRKPEPLVEIRLLIVEALLLLCKTKHGRDTLRNRGAYPVLREWHKEEEDDTVRDTIEQIVDRTKLLDEDSSTPPDSASVQTAASAKAGQEQQSNKAEPSDEPQSTDVTLAQDIETLDVS